MKKFDAMKCDCEIIKNLLSVYDDQDSAHFVMLAGDDGSRCFMTGGDVILMGTHLSEALARMIDATPGLDESFIDIVAMTVKKILSYLRTVRPGDKE